MITLSRQLVKHLRGIFRRMLPRSPSQADQIVELVGGNDGLRVRWQNRIGAAEYHRPGAIHQETLAITLDALSACEGARADEHVTLETHDNGVVLRWEDRSIPRSVIAESQPALTDFPALPPEWLANPPRLLAALGETMKIAPNDSSRNALNCVRLRPAGGSIAATDSRQLLIASGFAFPGDSDVLIPRTTLFSARELPTDLPVEVGLTADFSVFRIGPWTIWLPLDKQGRFPRVEDIIPATASAKTRVCLSDADREFLLDVIPRLPEGTDQEGRVTLDLNGSVSLLAKGDDSSPVTQVVLRNSRREGDEVRLNTDRQFLVRAAQLGFRGLEIHSPESPLVCRDEHRVYLWAALAETPSLSAGADAVRIESPLHNTHSHRPTRHIPPPHRSRDNSERTTTRMSHNRIAATLAGAPPPPVNGSPQPIAEPNEPAEQSTSFATVIQEAEAVKTSLRDAHAQVSRLIAALKRYRRQSKLVQSTLASLKQLQSLDA